MSWVYLDDKFHSNPKIVAVGNVGAGLYARALSYCGDHLTDGFVPLGWAREAAGPAMRTRLVNADLWVEVDGGYLIPDYLELNPSKEEALDRREKRRLAGQAGGKASARARGQAKGQALASALAQAESNGDATPFPKPLKALNPRQGTNVGEDDPARFDYYLDLLIFDVGASEEEAKTLRREARGIPEFPLRQIAKRFAKDKAKIDNPVGWARNALRGEREKASAA